MRTPRGDIGSALSFVRYVSKVRLMTRRNKSGAAALVRPVIVSAVALLRSGTVSMSIQNVLAGKASMPTIFVTLHGVVFDILVGGRLAAVSLRFRFAPATPDTTLRPSGPCVAAPRVARQGEAWWARQDSNLQPDRYERKTLPGNSSKISVFRSRSFTFVRVCSRGFCRITGGMEGHRTANRPRPDGAAVRPS